MLYRTHPVTKPRSSVLNPSWFQHMLSVKILIKFVSIFSLTLWNPVFFCFVLPLENLSVWGNDMWLMWLMASIVDSSLRDQHHWLSRHLEMYSSCPTLWIRWRPSRAPCHQLWIPILTWGILLRSSVSFTSPTVHIGPHRLVPSPHRSSPLFYMALAHPSS